MMVPKELDGAKVLLYTSNEDKNDFGVVDFNDYTVKITGLVIAQYDQSADYYLFACDLKWEVIGDTMHSSINEAISFAKGYYNINSVDFKKLI